MNRNMVLAEWRRAREALIPGTWDELVESAVAGGQAGASIVHFHTDLMIKPFCGFSGCKERR